MPADRVRACHSSPHTGFTLSYLLPLLSLALLALGGCQHRGMPEIRHAEHVDLERFMGSWYVIASIPTFADREAHNAIEHYALREDGRIDTTFTFRNGSFDASERTLTPVATVYDDPSNALWGMQFVWPFKADFRVVYVDDDYRLTIIGRQKRDYAWIMARAPQISEDDYARLTEMLAEEGYDLSALQPTPQCWPPECDRATAALSP